MNQAPNLDLRALLRSQQWTGWRKGLNDFHPSKREQVDRIWVVGINRAIELSDLKKEWYGRLIGKYRNNGGLIVYAIPRANAEALYFTTRSRQGKRRGK